MLDAKFDFDPVSYGKKLSLEVTRKEAALALAKEMKDKVSVFKDKPFAEWEKELVICEDSVKQLIAQSDGIDMQIEKIKLNEQQPIRDDQTRLERERAKIQAEINALEAEQRNILSKRYEGGKAFSLVLPNHDMDKILYRNILYANNWEYYISNYNADDHVFVGDMVRFDQNVSLSLMRMILLGDGSSEGLIKKLSDMVIADGTLADITSKRDLWNTEKEGFEAEHRDKLEELTKTDGIYEKFEKAWTAYWTTSQPLLNFQQVWDDFAGLTDPSETQRKVMFASVKDYLNKRTALDGDGNISEASITTTVDGITTTVQKKVYLVTEAEYLANQSSVENAIRNSRYYLSEIGLDYADGGAYKAYLDASRILFGTSSGKDNARSEDLSVDDFNGKLELNDDGTLKSSWELNQVLNNLKLNPSDFQQSVWFKKFQAATMYELLDSKITGRVTWQAILASARELLGDDTKPESVNGQIDAIKKEAAALDPKIETLGETIVAINKQYNDKAAEITKITADKITPLQFQKRILQSRKEAFEEMWRSILTIMGTNADGTVTPGWSESAGDIKEKLDVQIAQREDKIIEAEKALAIAQMKLAAFEEGLISGDDGAEELQRKEIADLEKKIAELKAEITQLQKEFEEETARKDHLMEIFLGSNK